jgi:hypothetical protein
MIITCGNKLDLGGNGFDFFWDISIPQISLSKLAFIVPPKREYSPFRVEGKGEVISSRNLDDFHVGE